MSVLPPIDQTELPSFGLPEFVLKALSELDGQQLDWISHRLATSSDAEACERAEIPVELLAKWKEQHPLDRVMQQLRLSRVEATVWLSQLYSYRAVTSANKLLDHQDWHARVQGIRILMKAAGLLDDRPQVNIEFTRNIRAADKMKPIEDYPDDE